MREWQFRAWDPIEKKMYSPEDLEEPDQEEETPKTLFGKISRGEVVAHDVKFETPRKLVLLQSTNWYDSEQNELFEGDIIEAENGKRRFVIGWSVESGSFVLYDDEESYIPGGSYMSDVIKLVGNIFEDSFEGYEFKERRMFFRAWDPEAKKLYMPEDLKDPEEDMMFSIYGYLSFGALYIFDFVLDPPMELIPMQLTGWKDVNGKDVYEGDILEIEGELGQISWSDEVGGFMFMSNDGSLFPGDADIASRVEVVGNIYQNEDVVPQLKW